MNLGDEFPNEAKAYLSYPTIKNIIDNILENANVSSSEIDLDAIIAKLKKEYSTKEICEKLGITISSTSSNEIEFSINCSIKDLYDMLSKVDSQMSSQLEGMVETIGSARLVLYVRVNVTNNLPVKVEAKLEGIKEAMQNALASNDDKTKVNAADFNFKLEFAYDATIPTLPDTKDYVPFNDLFKK